MLGVCRAAAKQSEKSAIEEEKKKNKRIVYQRKSSSSSAPGATKPYVPPARGNRSLGSGGTSMTSGGKRSMGTWGLTRASSTGSSKSPVRVRPSPAPVQNTTPQDDDTKCDRIIDAKATCDVSVITMDVADFTPLGLEPPVPGMNTLREIDESSGSFSRTFETSALFTFQRTTADGKSCSTTLNAKTYGGEEETMEHLVKRLQKMGAASGVLKFDRSEIEAIKKGDKVVVFSLVQVDGVKFGKAEFGKMRSSEMLAMTKDRPIVIEIQTEESLDGDVLDLF